MLLWAVPVAILVGFSVPILGLARAAAAESAALRREMAALAGLAGEVAGLGSEIESLRAGVRGALRSRPDAPAAP